MVQIAERVQVALKRAEEAFQSLIQAVLYGVTSPSDIFRGAYDAQLRQCG